MKWLEKIAIGEVWGVGYRWAKKLTQLGVHTAADLANKDANFIRTTFNIVLMRTGMELRGIACAHLEISEKKQSIMSSRSFGTLQTEYQYLAQAISQHCAYVYAKLRAQQQIAHHIIIFIQSNRFRKDLSYYANSVDFKLIHGTDDLCYLTKMAKFCLKKIYKKGIYYQKVGVLISDLMDKNFCQLDLFHQLKNDTFKTERLMTCLDDINRKYGRGSLYLAAEGVVKPWASKQLLKSPNYTTQWGELPVVR